VGDFNGRVGPADAEAKTALVEHRQVWTRNCLCTKLLTRNLGALIASRNGFVISELSLDVDLKYDESRGAEKSKDSAAVTRADFFCKVPPSPAM